MRWLAAAAAATVFAAAGGVVAFADNVVVDGDAATAITKDGEDLAFGVIACGVETSRNVQLAVKHSGAGRVYEGGLANPVTVSVVGATAGLSAGLDEPASIVLGDSWESGANNTLSGTVSGTVTVTSTTEGPGTGSVTFQASGLEDGKTTPLVLTAVLAVSWSTGDCAPANTPPAVQVTGVVDGASYELGEVPVAGCSVTDAEDGPSSFPATLSAVSGPLATYGLGEQTASCSHTDAGGLTDAAEATYSIVDTTEPTITLSSRTPTANPNGWNNAAVVVTWTCSDEGSGVVEATVSTTVSAEGADQSAKGTCTDHAGNTASDTVSGINIDTTAPTVALVGGPADGGEYYFGNVPAAPTCDASDALSGIDGECSVTGYSTSVGTHTVMASASDRAGNSAAASATYTVKAWTLGGFYQPVDMDKLNTVKGGSTVPLKFEVFAGDTELTDTAAVQGFTVKGVTCPDANASVDDIELVTTGGTSLRYDTTGGQFIQNWQTPKKSGACYTVTMTTQDGSSLSAMFKLK